MSEPQKKLRSHYVSDFSELEEIMGSSIPEDLKDPNNKACIKITRPTYEFLLSDIDYINDKLKLLQNIFDSYKRNKDNAQNEEEKNENIENTNRELIQFINTLVKRKNFIKKKSASQDEEQNETRKRKTMSKTGHKHLSIEDVKTQLTEMGIDVSGFPDKFLDMTQPTIDSIRSNLTNKKSNLTNINKLQEIINNYKQGIKNSEETQNKISYFKNRLSTIRNTKKHKESNDVANALLQLRNTLGGTKRKRHNKTRRHH